MWMSLCKIDPKHTCLANQEWHRKKKSTVTDWPVGEKKDLNPAEILEALK